MGKIVYDFREGLDKEKIVYKNETWNVKYRFYYILYMLATWIFTAAWFGLFQYSYINHEATAFWVYIGCWLAFMVVLLGIISYNLCVYYSNKNRKLIMRKNEEIKLLEKAIKDREEFKKKDHERLQNEYVTTRNNENERLNN